MSPTPQRPQRWRFCPGPRLADAREFLRLKEQGARMTQGCLIANWAPARCSAASRCGFVTGRRLGTAVERNRARRLLREAYRLHRRDLVTAIDLVLVARPSIRGLRLVDVERDLLRALRKARLLSAPAT